MNPKISPRLIFKLFAIILPTGLLLSSLGFQGVSTAQAQAPGGPQVITSGPAAISQPLRSMPPSSQMSQPQTAGPANLVHMGRRLKASSGPNASAPSASAAGPALSIVQTSTMGSSMPEPALYFDGISANNNVLPPDSEGDIGFDPATGIKYYFQWVNLQFQIWDVTDPSAVSSVYGPQNGNVLFAALAGMGAAGICQTHNDGDPIVLFDHLADRWMVSQFAYVLGNFEQCIAVSASGDPTGSWYEYGFQLSTSKQGDYPKFAVWPDGYYMTMNQFYPDGSWYGAGAAVFDRAAMLTGSSARVLIYDLNEYGPGLLPANLIGPPPALGTPAYFTEWDDNVYGIGDSSDTVRIWYAHTDWSTPALSTFGADTSHTANVKITTANVDPALCGNPNAGDELHSAARHECKIGSHL